MEKEVGGRGGGRVEGEIVLSYGGGEGAGERGEEAKPMLRVVEETFGSVFLMVG